MNLFSGKRFSFGLSSLFQRQRPSVVTSQSALKLSALPEISEILERPDALPQGCAAYFLPRALRDEELLVGRKKQLEDLSEAFADWQGGQPASVVVVGAQGCGKTSLVNSFLDKHHEYWRILRHEVGCRLGDEREVLAFFNRLLECETAAESIDDVVARLLDEPPKIIVIEGGHNLLLRVIGGRKALETFMYVVLRTRKRHFWLHTCRLLPWINMDRYAKVSRFFSHIMDLDLLSEENLREALERRLEKCALNSFYYRSRKELEKEPEARREEQEEKEGAFYRGILANSGSNFYGALYFFLLCCRYDMRTQSLLFYPPDRLDLTFVKEMDRMHLLALAELAGHGVLSAEEHRRIFRTKELESQTIFEFLEQLKLVVPVAGDCGCEEKVYDMSPIIHHSVKTALEQINLIY